VPRPIGVLIADDDPFVARLVRRVLGDAPDFEVLAVVEDAPAAMASGRRLAPELALVDVRMPGGGPAAARGIREGSPSTRIVALSGDDNPATVREMLAAGAVGYLVKGTPPSEFLEALRSICGTLPDLVGAPGDPAEPDAPVAGCRVLLALADPEALDALADAVDGRAGLELVGLAQTPYHAVSVAARARPDVAVVDMTMPSSGGARIAAELASVSAATRVIALGPGGDPGDALGVLRAGASSVVDGAGGAAEVVAAIERAARGGSSFEGGVAALVLENVRETRREPLPSRGRFERLGAILSLERLDIMVQPIVGVLDRRHPVGFEALARFPRHPTPGPDVWFAEAHRAGVGVELELLAIRSALEHLDRLPPGVFLSVNASPDGACAPELHAELARVDARRIVVELTEHAPVRDYDRLGDAIAALRGLGARVAVDDCGAGFASLRHVVLVGPDFLKLDVVLCRDVREASRTALTRALVRFAEETGSVVIAEGIEVLDDLHALRDLGVGLAQGYLLGEPARLDRAIA
jgi:EAL domain-containing protein (putative c-di-GMP-specific phosphodiesterase class I)/CheY-like chemotaxis protein